MFCVAHSPNYNCRSLHIPNANVCSRLFAHREPQIPKMETEFPHHTVEPNVLYLESAGLGFRFFETESD